MYARVVKLIREHRFCAVFVVLMSLVSTWVIFEYVHAWVSRPMFHEVVGPVKNATSHSESRGPYWLTEPVIDDSHGQLWLFDRHLNMIVVAIVGMDEIRAMGEVRMSLEHWQRDDINLWSDTRQAISVSYGHDSTALFEGTRHETVVFAQNHSVVLCRNGWSKRFPVDDFFLAGRLADKLLGFDYDWARNVIVKYTGEDGERYLAPSDLY